VTWGRKLLPLAALAAALALPASADAAFQFRDCNGIDCARVAVPLDRTGATPGQVSLYVERRAAARRPRRGVQLLLASGPGQSATFAYGGATPADSYREFAPFTPRNDIVAFDQRGTGRSGLLRCPELERASLVDAGAAAAACARRLGPRRGFYRTSDSVDDIEAVRAALGVDKLTLIGVSYGTFVAQAYAARYPTHVDRVLLDSILGVGGWDPFYHDMFHAIPRVLRTVCGTTCRRFTRDPVADVARLVARLARRPLRGRVTLANGRRRRAELTRQDLFFTVVSGDLDDVSRAAFPAAVTSALRGDSAPILRLERRANVDESGGSPREFSSGLYAATTCEEIPFPWPRFSDPATRPGAVLAAVSRIPPSELYPFDAATDAGNDFFRMCRRWPEASPAPYAAPGALTDIPVLMLSGQVDMRTPLEGARTAAAGWPNARVLEIPNTGHSVLTADLSGCAIRAARRFLRGGSPPAACGRRRNLFPAMPPVPASLRSLRPTGGVGGARGRVLHALELTLYDVAEDFLATLASGPDEARLHGAGLRGGRWSWDLVSPMRLDRVELVPGVRVSGRIAHFGGRRQRARLRISGPAGPDGRLVLHRGHLTGRLGGRSVRGNILTGVFQDARANAAGLLSLQELRRIAIRRRLAPAVR
jgi:pimeloyl-ACP methyl ester carboxylesterase